VKRDAQITSCLISVNCTAAPRDGQNRLLAFDSTAHQFDLKESVRGCSVMSHENFTNRKQPSANFHNANKMKPV